MIQAKSILTYSNGIWGAGSAPQLDNTNAGQKLLFIHALEDTNYEINGSFVATVGNGKNSRLEELPYALIDVTADNTSDLNAALSKSTILTTKETEEQFLNNFHQKKYRFSTQPYTSIGPVINPNATEPSTITDAIIAPSDLKQGQTSWIGTTNGGALAIGYCPTDNELSDIQTGQTMFPYNELYANTLSVEQDFVESYASSWAEGTDYIYTLPQGQLTSQMASELKVALFDKPIFAWLPKEVLNNYFPGSSEGAWVLCGKDGIATQASYIINDQWNTPDTDGLTLSTKEEYVTNAFPAPSPEALAMHTTQGGLWNSNETGIYWYAGLRLTRKPGTLGKGSFHMTWGVPYGNVA